MTEKILEEFREDLKEFYDMTEKFYNKEITVAEYKGFSGGFGSYAQRGGERSMLRLRLPAGEVEKEKLKFIAECIEKYQIDMVHFTTCQTIQLHNLTKDTVCKLISEAMEHGIITRGGGGDFPRNVMCSPLSGVEDGEYFDVTPYAKAVGDYLLGFIKKVKLPRKLKVCFSNSKKNETHATFRDLGFVAKENGKFDVYAAGGLGIKPKFGVCVIEDLEPSKVLYAVKTMVDVFTAHGNYAKRAASRSRFLQDTLGVEGLQKVFRETFEKNMEKENLNMQEEIFTTYNIEKEKIEDKAKKVEEEKKIENTKVVAQKQKGLYAVSYHPIGGVPEITFFRELYDIIKDMEEVRLRLTPDQGVYVVNLSAKEAEKVLELTKDDQGTEFERSTACIGADICQVGIGKSRIMLEQILKRVKVENFANGVLPAIHISGCPSSCSAHQTAVIGLRGGKKPSQEGPKDAFAIYENGSQKQGEETFGEELGVLAVEDIPEFFVELGRAVQKEGMTYRQFREKYPKRTQEIIQLFL